MQTYNKASSTGSSTERLWVSWRKLRYTADSVSYSAFSDKRCEPTASEIVEVLGPVEKGWSAFVQHLHDTYAVEEDLKFMYGQKYGWALRFRRRSSLLTALYPTSGAFVCMHSAACR